MLGLSVDVLHGYFLITDIFQLDMHQQWQQHDARAQETGRLFRALVSLGQLDDSRSKTIEPYETPQFLWRKSQQVQHIWAAASLTTVSYG